MVAGCSDDGGGENATGEEGAATTANTAESAETEATTRADGEPATEAEATTEGESETEAETETGAETETATSGATGAKITDNEFTVIEGEFSSEAVMTGLIENTGDSPIDYLEAAVTFYDEEGIVLGSGFTNVTDLPAGETWSFEVEFISYNQTADTRVTDHEVTLSDSAF